MSFSDRKDILCHGTCSALLHCDGKWHSVVFILNLLLIFIVCDQKYTTGNLPFFKYNSSPGTSTGRINGNVL